MKTKKYLLIIAITCVWLSLPFATKAQVTIGSNAEPHSGAVLDLKSTTQGILLPRVFIDDANDFGLAGNASAGEGMVVYNTNDGLTGGKGVYVWDGEKWTLVRDSGGDGDDGTVIITPPSHALGNSQLLGKRCFSHAEFNSATELDRTYTFTAVEGTVSHVEISYVSSPLFNGIEGNIPATINQGSSFSFKVKFVSSVPGGTGADAMNLYISYKVGTTTYQIPLTINLQPVQCCKVGNLQFLCYNLGADNSLPYDDASERLYGDYYQWGHKNPTTVQGPWSTVLPSATA